MTTDQSYFSYLMFAGTLWAPTYLIIIEIMLKGCKIQTDAMKGTKCYPLLTPFLLHLYSNCSLPFTSLIARPVGLVSYRLDFYSGNEEVAKLMPVMATYH